MQFTSEDFSAQSLYRLLNFKTSLYKFKATTLSTTLYLFCVRHYAMSNWVYYLPFETFLSTTVTLNYVALLLLLKHLCCLHF